MPAGVARLRSDPHIPFMTPYFALLSAASFPATPEWEHCGFGGDRRPGRQLPAGQGNSLQFGGDPGIREQSSGEGGVARR